MHDRTAAPDGTELRSRLMALYQAEREAMVRLAHLLTGSVEVAEDVVQEAFIRVAPRLGRIDSPGAYLRRSVVNLCHSHHRRRRVERSWADRQPPPDMHLPPELDDTWRLLQSLPARQREVLVLRFHLDLRLADIAELLDMPVGTVKSHVHRGLAALAEEVAP